MSAAAKVPGVIAVSSSFKFFVVSNLPAVICAVHVLLSPGSHSTR